MVAHLWHKKIEKVSTSKAALSVFSKNFKMYEDFGRKGSVTVFPFFCAFENGSMVFSR